MASMTKVLNGNIALLLFVLLIGCTNESNKEAKIIPPEENYTTVAEANSEKDDSKTDYSNNVSSKNKQDENDTTWNKSHTSAENQQNQANSWNTNVMTEEETTKEEADEELVKNDTNNKQIEPQKDIKKSKQQNGNQTNQIPIQRPI